MPALVWVTWTLRQSHAYPHRAHSLMGETDIHQIIIQIVIYNEDNKGRSVGSYKEIWNLEVGAGQQGLPEDVIRV